jgi:hypothetical protein
MQKNYNVLICGSKFINKTALKTDQVTKENSHRYNQIAEKNYIYQQFVNKEKKVKQNEKI